MLAVVLGVVAALGSAPGRIAVAAQTENRAAVIVNTGETVKRICVRFTEDSITGKEALERAGVDPVFHGMGGRGAAVCALCGTGCEAGDSCLTCDPEGRYWAYWRSDDGGPYQYSNAGVSNTIVTDGDVEGWQWGTGQAPPGAVVAEVCGEEPSPASDASGGPAAASAPEPSPQPDDGAGPTSGPVPPPADPAGPGPTTTVQGPGPTTTLPLAESTTSTADDGEASSDEPDDETDPSPSGTDDEIAATPISDDGPDDGGGGSTATSLAGFAAALAVIAGLTVRARRARRRTAPEG